MDHFSWPTKRVKNKSYLLFVTADAIYRTKTTIGHARRCICEEKYKNLVLKNMKSSTRHEMKNIAYGVYD